MAHAHPLGLKKNNWSRQPSITIGIGAEYKRLKALQRPMAILAELEMAERAATQVGLLRRRSFRLDAIRLIVAFTNQCDGTASAALVDTAQFSTSERHKLRCSLKIADFSNFLMACRSNACIKEGFLS